MSLLNVKESIIAAVPAPALGRYVFFVDSVSKQLYVKDSTNTATPVSNFLDTFQLYPANHSTSITTSIYTLDLTGRPIPVVGKPINIKLSSNNTYGTIQIVIAGLGTFNLFKEPGISFAAGELKAGQILSIIVDSGAAYYLGGFIQTNLIAVADTAALKALMTAGGLTVGAWYQFNFTTSYTLNNVIVNAPAPEAMLALAVSSNAVASDVLSIAHPQDDVKIDFNDPTYGQKIVYRKDNIQHLTAPFDWRNVKFRRGQDPQFGFSSSYLVTDPTAPTFTSAFQDQYCFNNSQSGAGCFNVTIEPITLNNANAAVVPYIGWGIDNCNITVSGSNIHIRNSHSISIVRYISGSSSANPALLNALIIENSYECIIANASSGVIQNSKQVYLHGNISISVPEYNSLAKFSIKNCVNINVISTQSAQNISLIEFLIENSDSIYLQATVGNTSKVNIFDCVSVWISDSNQSEFIGCSNSAWSAVQNSTYEQCNQFCSVGSTNEYIVSSRNLVSKAVSGTNIETLKDAYQFRDTACTVEAVVAGTPQTIVAGIPAATFSNGMIVLVTNSVALLNKASSIAFDTNADNIADTIAYPLVVGGWQSNYPAALAAAAGNFYMMFYAGKFYLLFATTNCPFRIDVNNSQFDGLTSNFSKIINYNAGAITISDPTNYDYGHVGLLSISHALATDQLSQVLHSTGSYPNLKREIRNAVTGTPLTLLHGIGANFLALPGGSDRTLDDAFFDFAIIDRVSAPINQFRVTGLSTLKTTPAQIRQAIFNFTSGQIRTLFSAPQTLVPAPGVTKMIELISAYVWLIAGSQGFNFPSSLFGIYALSSPGGLKVLQSNQIAADGYLNNASADSRMFFKLANNYNDVVAPLTLETALNRPLLIGVTSGADATLGNGSMKVIIDYKIVDWNL